LYHFAAQSYRISGGGGDGSGQALEKTSRLIVTELFRLYLYYTV